MNDEANVEPQAGQGGVGAVDKERHVVVDDLDDAALAYPCLLHRGRKDADLGPASRPLCGKAPDREGCARDQIGGRYVLVECSDERLDCGALSLCPPSQAGSFCDKHILLGFAAADHGRSSLEHAFRCICLPLREAVRRSAQLCSEPAFRSSQSWPSLVPEAEQFELVGELLRHWDPKPLTRGQP